MLENGALLALKDISQLATTEFRNTILNLTKYEGWRLSVLLAAPFYGRLHLIALLALDKQSEELDNRGQVGLTCKSELKLLISEGIEGELHSLSSSLLSAHLFEREIFENWDIKFVSHPWLKPVRFIGEKQAGEMDFFKVAGDEVHEVAVGPVHAGIIEPGHFRFSCQGEEVLNLEISLGYQHRGVERALIGGPNKRSIHYAETLAGDTTSGHATCYAQTLESLSGTPPSKRAEAIRAILLELERLANHTGDLGALCQDIGYLPSSSFFGRLRGDFLNMTALICGSRFGRGAIRGGGVNFDIDKELCDQLLQKLSVTMQDVEGAANLCFNSFSVRERFENTGVLPTKIADGLGVVGVAARASNIKRDVRSDLPFGYYQNEKMPICSASSGDVMGRAEVRLAEIRTSYEFVSKVLKELPEGVLKKNLNFLIPNSIAINLVEGWRGEIVHIGITDETGSFSSYKIVDPSFHNWSALAFVMRGEQISNFPLCNKSFNLSYCGHDL